MLSRVAARIPIRINYLAAIIRIVEEEVLPISTGK